MAFSMVISGFIVAFFYGWLMTLVTLAALPVVAIGCAFYARMVSKQTEEQEKEYS
jgi:ABC-type multidrug transport system fused ATPase/permease subunit